MKIGILTFHCAYNFGAVLQCYALFSTIKKMGHDVEVIDYRPSYLATTKEKFHYYTFINKTPWKVFDRVKSVLQCRKQYRKFSDFSQKYLKFSIPCYDHISLLKQCQKFDCVIVGSDQVWCDRFNGNDSAWFGLDTGNNTRWVGYAVSAGKTKYDVQKLDILTQRFQAIGARENDLYEQLKAISKKKIAHVLDPTLLAAADTWSYWNTPIVKEPYILTYQARESDDVFRIAREIAQQIGVRRIIPVDFYPNVKARGEKTFVCSPDEFVSLIANAKCVVTTSFHGTAFSIIKGTPFYTVRLNDGADGRSQDLLQSLGLTDRMVDKTAKVLFSKFNILAAHNELQKLKEQSLEFLNSSIL